MRYKDYRKYKIPDDRFRELMYFCCQYPKWKEKLEELTIIGSPEISGMPSGSGISDPTMQNATKRADLDTKVRMIEDSVKEADAEIYTGLLKGVTMRNCNYNWLLHRGFLNYGSGKICGRDKYYHARRKFYWILDQKRG